MERVTLRSIMSEGLVRSGFSFRERITNNPHGSVSVVQMKDLLDGCSGIAQEGIFRVAGEDIGSQHLLWKGDVLFVSKGANNRAVVYDLDLPKAVAASAFFVLRPDPAKVVPLYLAWWINQKPVQEYLHQNMAGTYIPNITKPTVEGITLPLPPLEQQRQIAALSSLAQAEQRIMNELMIKRQQLIDRLLISSIKQSTNTITE